MSFSVAITALGAIVFLNLWLLAGSLVLSRAIDRRETRRPRQMVHAVLLMAAWPWLLWSGCRQAATHDRDG